MKYDLVEEYDGYTLPEPLKEETPETRAKREAALEELKAVIRRHHELKGKK